MSWKYYVCILPILSVIFTGILLSYYTPKRSSDDPDKLLYMNFRTPLHDAIIDNSLSIIAAELKSGYSVNSQDEQNNTPLHLAVGFKREEIIQLLLDNGARINVKNVADSSPFHMAIEQGNHKLVKLLLFFGADPDLPSWEMSPLHLAVERSEESIVELLVKNVNHNQDTPLHMAVRLGNIGITTKLVTSTNIKMVNAYGDTPLHVAVDHDYDRIANILIKRGAIIDSTLLHKCVERDHIKTAKVLLTNGANPNVFNSNGQTPLFVATMKDDYDFVELLLSHHADPKIKSDCYYLFLGCKTPIEITDSDKIIKLLEKS